MVIDFSPFFGRHPDLERMFEQHWPPGGYSRSQQAFPLLNVSHDEAAIYVHCRLPGVERDEVEISLVENSLTIKGERKPIQGRYFRQERPSGPFQRVATINAPIDRDNIKATLTDGILAIILPKIDAASPRTIPITTP